MQQPTLQPYNLGDYNTVFRKHLTPDQKGEHDYTNANNVTYNNHLGDIETSILVIDSQSRNWDKETPSDYTVNLKDHFEYVVSMELIDGYVPASAYLINETNNTITFQEGDVIVSASIKVGNYEIYRLLEKLGRAMTKASPNAYTYQCELSSRKQKVTIKCDHVVGLILTQGQEFIGDRGQGQTMVINPVTGKKEIITVQTGDSRKRYAPRSIAKVLGFQPIDLFGTDSYTGQMIYDLKPYEYLAIYVNTENADDFKKVTAPSPNGGADGCFAVVPLRYQGNCYDVVKYSQVIDNARYLLTFNPPINFEKIKIQFKTIDGNLYDFNGLDNYLVFEVRKAFGRNIVTNLNNLK